MSVRRTLAVPNVRCTAYTVKMATMKEPRQALTKQAVVAAAIDIADAQGLEAVSMRAMAAHFGVVPMALYRYVANKDALLDQMLDHVLVSIDRPTPAGHWRDDARALICATRAALTRHGWVWEVLSSRTVPSAAALDHQEAMLALARRGGLSVALTHHLMHALGSRLWGFTAEVYASDAPPPDEQTRAAMASMLAARWPYVVESASYAFHDQDSVVGAGCDDDFEFFFAIDLILDGVARLHQEGWEPPRRPLVQ